MKPKIYFRLRSPLPVVHRLLSYLNVGVLVDELDAIFQAPKEARQTAQNSLCYLVSRLVKLFLHVR